MAYHFMVSILHLKEESYTFYSHKSKFVNHISKKTRHHY